MYVDLEYIQENADIIKIFNLLFPGRKLEQRGKEYFCLCPLHDEKTPSFSINVDKQLFNCFGCGRGGNVFSLVSYAKDYDFKEAVNFVVENLGIEVTKAKQITGDRKNTSKAVNVVSESSTIEVTKAKPTAGNKKNTLKEMAASNVVTLKKVKTAKEYLTEKRKIPLNLIVKMQIGFASEGYFKGYITFPYFDYDGKNVLFMNGRRLFGPESPVHSIEESYNYGVVQSVEGKKKIFVRLNNDSVIEVNLKKEMNLKKDEEVLVKKNTGEKDGDIVLGEIHRYPKWKNVSKDWGEPVLYNLQALKEDTVTLAEGVIDTLSLLSLGINAVGSPGAHAFKKEWGKYFKGKRVNILLDLDEAGEKGTEKIIKIIEPEARDIRVFQFNSANDVNAYLCTGGDVNKLIKALT